MPLPKPPAEVPVRRDLGLLAPKFHKAVTWLLLALTERGFDPMVFETFRDNERQRFLYGFGREYDDGRGVVTKASTADTTWHGFGLAVDIISRKHQWNAPDEFWNALGEESRKLGLVWGGDWIFKDRPHVQHGAPMRQSPSPLAKEIRDGEGLEALWRVVGAAE